ncbi:VWA domain-containing protein [candidate division GN15 bacterium]|nr:VWA domain-containing protein [candidate division GN15 bacterium]
MGNVEFFGFAFDFFELLRVEIPPVVIFVIGAVIVALMIWYQLRHRRVKTSAVKYSDVRIVSRAARTGRHRFRMILPVLRVLAVIVFVLAFARPRAGTEIKEITSEGIDIMLALDVSSSMQAEDFKPHNRLYVAKEEIKKFVNKRVNDRIGLVVFARNSFTQCPLTVDYGVLLKFVDQIDFGVVEDGTAIGMAIANGVNRLRDSESESKIMILLTDGDNNAGEIDPLTAANLATAFDIKIYTIGAGKPGNAMFPVQDPIFGKRYVYQPTKINEEMLKEIADITGGQYFRARSGEELDEIYTLIDEMEKTEVKVAQHTQYTELFHYFTALGLALVVLEMVLAGSLFRKLP